MGCVRNTPIWGIFCSKKFNKIVQTTVDVMLDVSPSTTPCMVSIATMMPKVSIAKLMPINNKSGFLFNSCLLNSFLHDLPMPHLEQQLLLPKSAEEMFFLSGEEAL